MGRICSTLSLSLWIASKGWKCEQCGLPGVRLSTNSGSAYYKCVPCNRSTSSSPDDSASLSPHGHVEVVLAPGVVQGQGPKERMTIQFERSSKGWKCEQCGLPGVRLSTNSGSAYYKCVLRRNHGETARHLILP
jgi:ssDNA-binding Zn-finger/Zn-ribbon topoisomerase 1